MLSILSEVAITTLKTHLDGGHHKSQTNRTMSSTVLERIRSSHEFSERAERAIIEILDEKTSGVGTHS